jgi:DNA-binding transcriptional LysR family regulator
MALDVDRLRVFREVAACGSFTAAARSLSYTQPAISHHINRLERELGVTLVERSARGLTLTAPGEALLAQADGLLARIDDIERQVVELAHAGGNVRLIAFPSAAATLVPHAVASFRTDFPSATLQLAEADPPNSLPELKHGDWDMAVAYDYPITGEPLDPSLDYETLFFDRMALCLHRDDPRAATRGALSLRDVSRDHWVAPYDCVCRTALELACRQAGFAPEVVSESNDYMAMQGLVAAGVGVALVPRLVSAMALRPEVVLRPISGSDITRVVAITSRAGGYTSPAALAMAAALHEAIAVIDDPALPLDRASTHTRPLSDDVQGKNGGRPRSRPQTAGTSPARSRC